MVKFDKTVGRGILVASLVFAGLAVARGAAQEAEETVVRNHIKITDADMKAAANVTFTSHHVMAANVPGAKEKSAALNAENDKRVLEELGRTPEADLVRPE